VATAIIPTVTKARQRKTASASKLALWRRHRENERRLLNKNKREKANSTLHLLHCLYNRKYENTIFLTQLILYMHIFLSLHLTAETFTVEGRACGPPSHVISRGDAAHHKHVNRPHVGKHRWRYRKTMAIMEDGRRLLATTSVDLALPLLPEHYSQHNDPMCRQAW